MAAQQQVSLERNEEWVGRTLPVLVEGEPEGDGPRFFAGRTFRDAPEVDGLALFADPGGNDGMLGSMVNMRVLSATAYDLWGEVEA
jgi:ribosomal protein S12 methylthiotransferase